MTIQEFDVDGRCFGKYETSGMGAMAEQLKRGGCTIAFLECAKGKPEKLVFCRHPEGFRQMIEVVTPLDIVQQGTINAFRNQEKKNQIRNRQNQARRRKDSGVLDL